ncbi:MAG: hypothetical protein KDI98_01220 [Hyphomicrobiaceae bacterium]|nr:hypothetical protein [Hyphomicrobiaceae bacterium]
MATTSNTGINSTLAFLLGGALVAIAVLAAISADLIPIGDQPDVSITLPGVGTVEGEVRGTAD